MRLLSSALFLVHPTHSPLPRHQTPAAFHLQTPDGSLSLPFPSRPLGPLPVSAGGSKAQPLPGGASHPLNSQGLLLICLGSVILLAGHSHPSHTSSIFPPTFLFFTLRRTGKPSCLPHPPGGAVLGMAPSLFRPLPLDGVLTLPSALACQVWEIPHSRVGRTWMQG